MGRHNMTLLCLNLDVTQFSIKQNYNIQNRRNISTSDDEEDIDMQRKDLSSSVIQDGEVMDELAEHQQQLLKDIESYQKRNQEALKKRKFPDLEEKPGDTKEQKTEEKVESLQEDSTHKTNESTESSETRLPQGVSS